MSDTVVQFFQAVGVPTGICVLFMWGVYRVLTSLLLPVANTLNEAIRQTMQVNSEMVVELKGIRAQSNEAKELAAAVTSEIARCHAQQRDDHRIMLAKLNGGNSG